MDKDPKYVDIYYAIGYALDQWVTVENSLSYTFIGACLSHSTRKVLSLVPATTAAFWATHSLRNKLEITDAAVRASGCEECVSIEWRRLHSKISSKNNKRNELAHFQITESKNGKMVLRPYYAPSKQKHDYYASLFRFKEASVFKEMDANDIYLRGKSFEFLSRRITLFNKAFGGSLLNKRHS